MRILFVNVYAYVTGGADVQCLELCRGLRQRGHEVALLATESDRNEDRNGVFVPVTVTHATRDELPFAAQLRIALKALWNPDASDAMRRLLSDFRPDVVHVHKLYPQLSVAPVVLANRAGVPVIQTLHDYQFIAASPTDDRGRWLDHDETRFSYRLLNSATLPIRRYVHTPMVSTFIAVSRFVAQVHARRGIRATVLPNFVPTPTEPNTIPGFEARRGIVYLGRLRPEKGVRHVVEIARQLPEVPVSVAGWGALADYIAEQARHLPNLEFLGRLPPEDTRALFRGARLVVVPSLWSEPAGLVSLEAMAEGTPVVAYSSGGLAEYVADSGGGIVVPRDAAFLARVCAALHDDGTTWRELSLSGIQAVLEAHSLEGYLVRLERIYGEALSRGAS